MLSARRPAMGIGLNSDWDFDSRRKPSVPALGTVYDGGFPPPLAAGGVPPPLPDGAGGTTGASLGSGSGAGVGLGVAVGFGVGDAVGSGVGVGFGVTVGVGVGVTVGSGVGVTVGSGVGVGVGFGSQRSCVIDTGFELTFSPFRVTPME